MDMKAALNAVLQPRDLSTAEMNAVMRLIMTGQATPAQIGGFLIALRCKGETVAEIAAAAKVMRELATPVNVSGNHLVDTCGTGGDGANTFNISTVSAFVVAAAGGQVAKHGNRSVSGNSGSADLLEKAGAKLALTASQITQCIDNVGVGFMFAPLHHGAMKHAIGPRKELGVRTIFNVLGPLTNPANVPNQVMGVYAKSLVEPVAHVLQQLGSKHVMVIHADDGLDEISIATTTTVAELKHDTVNCYTLTPEQFAMQRTPLDTLKVASTDASLAIVNQVLAGDKGPCADIVALNAGAAIYVAGLANSIEDGVNKALAVIGDGSAKHKLAEFVKLTQSF